MTTTQKADVILHPVDTAKLLPPSVYFSGQRATIEARNSGGVRFANGAMMLAVVVDSSGYSSGLQQKYQAYLIAETPLEFEGHKLAPGAYGCGFIANHNFVVMDIGGHDLFTVHSTNDEVLHRPTPLQVLAGSSAGHYRLYEGRNYVEFSRAK
ncbi:MAG: hypothetical protein ACYC46_10270 [Acidobacteriaceae bacterium]